eukprot:10723752-Alexandrium_andersonii.AAC.1
MPAESRAPAARSTRRSAPSWTTWRRRPARAALPPATAATTRHSLFNFDEACASHRRLSGPPGALPPLRPFLLSTAAPCQPA